MYFSFIHLICKFINEIDIINLLLIYFIHCCCVYYNNYYFCFVLYSTFVCPTEILAFSDQIKEFKRLNIEVVAASVDSHFTHLAWINTPRKDGGLENIAIPLISDLNHKISKDYGVYLEDLGHTLRYDFSHYVKINSIGSHIVF